MRLTTLTQKAVVNIRNGECLGYIIDLKIDPCNGRICSIFVFESHDFSIKGCREQEISWSSICKIGEDTVLVDICGEERRKKLII